MMIDKQLLLEILDKYLQDRIELHSDLQETNSFNEVEDNDFSKKTEQVEHLRVQIENDEFISKDEHLNLAADFKNYKMRTERDAELMKSKAKESFVIKLLPIVDDFERALEEMNFRELTDECSSFDVGVQMTYENMIKMLDSIGVKKVDCEESMMFDVDLHEAISVQPRENYDKDIYQSGSIFKVLQNGWELDGKVIRHAKVIVME